MPVEALRMAIIESLREEGLTTVPDDAHVTFSNGDDDEDLEIRSIEWEVEGAPFCLTEKGISRYRGLLDKAFARLQVS